ncbi:MAPEG family protein [Kordiimonas sp. SCSIO 12610]|uniref:MAPEG family protein n=1 Tax=Kordiimonas sp. SCSIO 12610 TaxID=2829597 RepID=UPI00210C789F|nr:MAPEG family protein [Kordiimonas sp. SCSIO 12610]UTW54870.1 MAPEG family protein [Kordiimonas sp. SCSIO 12610]
MGITLITSSIIGILLALLTFNVGRWRIKTKTNLGSGDSNELECAIRAHGNLIEYAPVVLILIGLLEYSGANSALVLGLGVTFVIARIAHGYGLGFTPEGKSIFRAIGTMLTILTLLVASISGLVIAYS